MPGSSQTFPEAFRLTVALKNRTARCSTSALHLRVRTAVKIFESAFASIFPVTRRVPRCDARWEFYWNKQAGSRCVVLGLANITLGRDGERWLDDWMHRNAFVAWADMERPWEVEAQLLRQFPCPHNLSHNAHHPFAEFLKTSRKAALRRAHQMAVDVESMN